MHTHITIKKIKRIVTLISLGIILVRPLVLPYIIYAQDITPPADPAPIVVDTPPAPATDGPTPDLTPPATDGPTPDVSPSPIPDPTPAPTPDPSPSPTPPATDGPALDLTLQSNLLSAPLASPAADPIPPVITNNQSDVVSSSNTTADTGQNTTQAATTTAVTTGDAVAIGNLTSVNNVTAINSPISIVIFNITPEQKNNLDLNQIWLELQAIKTNNDPTALPPFLATHNYITIQNYLSVTASTGQNQISNTDTATLQTGDAIAAGNLVSVANVTLFDSVLMIGIINILPDSTANLILPRPDYFQTNTPTSPDPSLISSTSNLTATTSAETIALTGQNTQTGPVNILLTGSAISLLNLLSLLNITTLYSSAMIFTVNNAGNWNQGIAPGITTAFFSSSPSPESNTSASPPIITDNRATVANYVSVTASTGNNTVDSNQGSTIVTGNASAITNIISLINATLIHSSLFIGVANILGNWFGHVYYAYPDLGIRFDGVQTEVNPGHTATYTITVGNYGYDTSPATVSFDLPQDTEYLSDTSGITPTVSDHHLTWDFGSLAPNQQTSFKVTIKIADSFNFSEHAFVPDFHIVKQAYAADTPQRDITVAAVVSGSLPELGQAQKQATAVTRVTPNSSDNSTETRQIQLDLTVQNNVNQFIYLGDTVTFTIKLKNNSDVTASNTVITHNIIDNHHQIVGSAVFPIGTVDPNKGGTLSFGMTISNHGDFIPGQYTTETIASAHSPDGSSVDSGRPVTDFSVRAHTGFLTVPTAAAANYIPGAVLGTQDSSTPEDIFPYLLLILLSVFWFIAKHNHRINPKPINYIRNSLAYLLVILVFTFSIYKVGVYYRFVKSVSFITTTYSEIIARLPR